MRRKPLALHLVVVALGLHGDLAQTPQARVALGVHVGPRQREQRAEAHGVLHPHHLRNVADVLLEQAQRGAHVLGVVHAALTQAVALGAGVLAAATLGAVERDDDQVRLLRLDVLHDLLVDARVDVGAHLALAVETEGHHVDLRWLGRILLVGLEGRWRGRERGRGEQEHGGEGPAVHGRASIRAAPLRIAAIQALAATCRASDSACCSVSMRPSSWAS